MRINKGTYEGLPTIGNWEGRMATIRNRFSDSLGWLVAANLWNSLCALACVVFFAPLMLAVYLLVRADGGPALVSSAHLRPDGTAVRTWRFRTMRRYRGQRDDRLPWQSGDCHATAVGRFLRRTRTAPTPAHALQRCEG